MGILNVSFLGCFPESCLFGHDNIAGHWQQLFFVDDAQGEAVSQTLFAR